MIDTINDDNFHQQVIENRKPVVVIFEKCCWGAAHIVKPILEKLAIDYTDDICVFRYDLDENSIFSKKYNVEDSTTVFVFNKGVIVNRTGVISRDEFIKIINSIISIH